MKMKSFKKFAGFLAATLLVGVMAPASVSAEELVCEWREENGNLYWYEDGVKQGVKYNEDGTRDESYRGKEIWDPVSDAWYWLDAVDDGKKAVSKDVYQESESGIWGDETNAEGLTVGKWVRYDAEGRMVKGWNTNENGTYFFDYTYGTMAKGYATIEGKEYYFNAGTGVQEQDLGEVPEFGWKEIDGNWYWYEGGVRQGYSVKAGYRGKEIFDPESNAWYWLDNVDGGKKATNKDVYQESQADDEGNIGKWVHYDENGHMVKGWYTNSEGNTYYFEPTYGTMTKGYATIDGKYYHFNETTGICEGEVKQSEYKWVYTGNLEFNDEGKIVSRYEYQYDDNGNQTRYAYYTGNKIKTEEVKEGNSAYIRYEYYSDNVESLLPQRITEYTYDANGNATSQVTKYYIITENEEETELKASLWSETAYTLNGDTITGATGKVYEDGKVTAESVTEYQNGLPVVDKVSYLDENDNMALYYTGTSEYDENNALKLEVIDYVNPEIPDSKWVYENNSDGNCTKKTSYNNDVAANEFTYEYSGLNMTVAQSKNLTTGTVNWRYEYTYNENDNVTEEKYYYPNYSTGELTLINRYVYTYNEQGRETGSEYYSFTYDNEGNRVEYKQAYSVTTYVPNDNYVDDIALKSYDRYSGFAVVNADGTVSRYSNKPANVEGLYAAYQYGYAYDYDENGTRTDYYRYTSDDQYKPTIERHTVYGKAEFSSADTLGKSYDYVSSTYYDANEVETGHVVSYYRTVRR